MVSLVEEWREAMDKNNVVGTLFLDVLGQYGVRGKELEWFNGYLSGRRQTVCIGEAKSKWTEVKRGVPRGSILEPLLFILYVNDLPQIVQSSAVKQYVDDTTMTLVAKDVTTLKKGLEQHLEEVLRWANGNGLKLNTGKTKLLLLGRKRRQKELVQVKVEMGDEKIVRSKAAKCLEVVIDDKLNWKKQVQNVRRKCFTGLVKLRRLKNVLPSTTKKQLCNALVLSHMNYCSVVWQECRQES